MNFNTDHLLRFRYRENRNDTAHDYGEGFARLTVALMPDFIPDARRLEARLRERFGRDHP